MANFIIGQPVRGKNFYGYEKLITSIIDQPWVWLCGQRRVGKTSLLRRLEKIYESEEFIPLYYDLARIPEKEINGEVLFKEFYYYYEDLFYEKNGIKLENFHGSPAKRFGQLVRKLSFTGKKVVFLWDETERLIDLEKNDCGFLEILRANLHGDENFHFIITATQRLSELFGLKGRCSSFVASFYWKPIAGLDEKASNDLLLCKNTGGWCSPLPDSVIKKAAQWCGGHPIVLQYLGTLLDEKVQGDGEKVNDKLLHKCFNEIIYNESAMRIMQDDFAKLTPAQQILMTKMFWYKDDKGVPINVLASGTPHTKLEMKQAAGFLANYGYIFKNDLVKLRFKFYAGMCPQYQSKTNAKKVDRIRRTVFISYSHQDEEYLKELMTYIEPFARTDELEIWHDQQIKAGEKWAVEIEQALNRAWVAILIISPNFLDSKFISSVEVPRLLTKAVKGGSRIFCLHARKSTAHLLNWDVDGQKISLTDFQAFNSPDSPLNAMKEFEKDTIYVKCAETIFKSAKYL